MTIKELGLYIKSLREKKKLLQSDLAKLTETKQPAIARLETGKLNICFKTLSAIADALGYDLIIKFVKKKVK